MDWKSEQEWIIIRWFRDHFPDFPKGRLVKGESPDFRLLVSPRNWIGIEIVGVHPPEKEWSQNLLGQAIGSTVTAKEEKAPAYRKDKPRELWLILVANDLGATGDRETNFEGHAEPGSRAFDRVFLFDLYRHRVTELLSLSAQGCKD
ncbi:MAG: hypothetical protein R6V75_01020 [Bacteroidales bacterium]